MQQSEIIVKDSTICDTASLFQGCKIVQSEILDHVTVGDFSRITSSKLGDYVKIDRNSLVYYSTIGRYTYSGPFDMIFKVSIGSFTSISYGVTIGPPEHDYSKITTHPFLYDSSYGIFSEKEVVDNHKFDKPINIGSDVWIGCNVTILRGVSIGHGAVIGANSLVNKDIPPYAIAAGCPAKIIKYRFDRKTINKLLKMEWWNWDLAELRKNKEMFLCNKI